MAKVSRRRVTPSSADFVEQLECRYLMAVSVTAKSFQYAGNYGGPFSGNNEKYLFNFAFNDDVSDSLSDSFRLEAVTGTDPLPIYTDNFYYDYGTNTATFALGFTGSGVLPNGNYRAVLSKLEVIGAETGAHLDHDGIIDFKVLAGDANGDGSVNVVDLGILSNNWQQSPRDFTQGDFNYSNNVEIGDLGILSSNWQTTIPTPPTAADQITAGLATANSIDLTWQDVQPGAAGYRIQRSTNGADFDIYQSVSMNDPSLVRHVDSVTNITNVSWTDTSVLDATRYFYRVRAYGNGLDTAYTPKTAVTTPLARPVNVVATALSAHRIRVTWEAGSSRAAQYYVYRRPDDSEEPWVRIATINSSNTLTYIDADVIPRAEYQYYVSARNSVLESAPSDIQALATMTLAQNINLEMNALISGKTASSDLESLGGDTLSLYSLADDYSTSNYPNGHYIRNPNLWASGVDLTCIPTWNSFWSARWTGSVDNGILVTPTLLLQNAHFGTDSQGAYGAIAPGSTIRFVSNDKIPGTNDNVVIVRTIADNNPNDDGPNGQTDPIYGHHFGTNQLNGVTIPGTDIRILQLTEPVPSSIKPARIFSDAISSALNSTATELPLAFGNFARQLHIANAAYSTSTSILTQRPPINSSFRQWNKDVIIGDSSSPLFAILDGSPVVLGTWQGPPGYNCSVPNIAYYLRQIEASTNQTNFDIYRLT